MTETNIANQNGTGSDIYLSSFSREQEDDGVDTSKDTDAKRNEVDYFDAGKRGFYLNAGEVIKDECDFGGILGIVNGDIGCTWKVFRTACQRLGISYIDAFSEIDESRLINNFCPNLIQLGFYYEPKDFRRDLKAILTGEDDTASVLYYLYCCYKLDLKPGKVFIDAFGNVTDGEVDEVRNRGYVKNVDEITYGKMYDIPDCKIGCRIKDFWAAQKRFGEEFQGNILSDGYSERLKKRLQPVWEKYRGLNSYDTNSLLINAVKGKNDITVAEYIVLCAMKRLDPNHLSVDASGNVVYQV